MSPDPTSPASTTPPAQAPAGPSRPRVSWGVLVALLIGLLALGGFTIDYVGLVRGSPDRPQGGS